jgi:hypothetical protein
MKDRPRALAVLIAVFLVGIIVGAAGSFFWLKPSERFAGPIDGRRPSPPNGTERSKFPELHLAPGLTPEQEKQFGAIFAETREKLEALRKEQWEKMAELDNKINAMWVENDRRLRAVLNEEQRVIFDNWVNKKREWREKSPRHMGPEPPNEYRRMPDQR